MKQTLSTLFLLIPLLLNAQEWTPREWPVLTRYDAAHLQEIALPLGGIGTGTVSLGGRGELRDWEIMNVPAKHFNTGTAERNAPFFAIYTKDARGRSTTTMLAGPLYPNEYNSPSGSPVDNFGLPRFREASFDAAYPFGQVSLSDPELPVQVRIKGFNPLVPTDADKSGLPVAVLCYLVTNRSDTPLEVSVSGSLRNFIGRDGQKNDAKDNVNEFRSRSGLSGIYLFSNGVPRDHQAWGTIALTTDARQGVSYRTSSKRNNWNQALLNFWDDFSADGELTERDPSGENDPMASLAVKKTLRPGETVPFTFFFTWSFPNRIGWSDCIEGNYYCLTYDDAWTAAEKIVPRIPAMEEETLRFVNALLSSTYPDVVKEAALYNLSVLRSQTVFRLPDGHLMGWEGVNDHTGSCHGSCTHVWNYEVATPFLFGELARSMRDVEFTYATRDDDGCMNFRADLPLSKAAERHAPAADGQMGCIMKAYREWQLSGDTPFLAEHWPKIRKALAFAWVDKGWDGDQDGVMEGSQHNTMDVNYFGPNPQMQFWYMGALLAGERMALAMKDKALARKCRDLFERGSAWTDAHLFNGEYYEHRITDPQTFEFLDMDDPSVKIPDYQLGRGCLVDQLVGQYMAHICGLGYLGDPAHIRTTLESILKYNYVEGIGRRFNNMRSFALGDENALLMASWPHGRLEVPFPYFGECMTGFEYAAAVGMLYEGQTENGLQCIRAIRERFDGARRSPFNEPECGYHYARSMASWAAVLALSDFHYSGVDQTMNFTAAPGRYFWSNGYAYGVCEVSSDAVRLEVLKGSLDLKALTLSGCKKPVATRVNLSEGGVAECRL